MNFDAEVKREIRKIAVGCIICTAITMLAFFVLGQLGYTTFDYTVLIGGVLGFVTAFGNFFFMCVGVVRALETGDEAAAKLKLRSSYLARTVFQIGMIALALALDFINWIPVALAVFYPRITITVCNLWKMFVMKGAPASDSADTTEEPVSDDSDEADEAEQAGDEPDEEKPDEFERFVSGFYKGDKNTKNNS